MLMGAETLKKEQPSTHKILVREEQQVKFPTEL